MQHDEDDPFGTYTVVVNHEEQYSIWPAEKDVPNGWRAAGKTGSRAECLVYIGDVWTDMRPLSLRAYDPSAPPLPASIAEFDFDAPEVPSLVDRLSTGEHPLIFSCRPERTATALRERLDLGFVHVTFTGTRGGTELGLRVDPGASDWSGADFERAAGVVHLVGSLTLDDEDVRCVATIDLGTLAGSGRLERIHEAAST